ncbi:MAG: UrcA family protein [Alphaproteobacteria bacterium]|nr:UrcA family protein [Alphaproteobacteria bacterium]
MKILLSLAALAATVAGAPAVAEAPSSAAAVVVRYADLDLYSAAGRRVLDRRIDAAVRDACGSASDADLHGRNAVRACVAQTKRAVAAQRAAVRAAALRPTGERFAAGR